MLMFEVPGRGHGGLQAIDRLAVTDPAEIAGTDHGEEIQTDVGRRGPMRDPRFRILLEVVRRQVQLVSGHERLEETPGAAGHQPQLSQVPLVGEQFDRFQARADTLGHQGGGCPRQHGRQRDQQLPPSADCRHQQRSRRRHQPAGHLLGKSTQGTSGLLGGRRRGRPLQQVAMRNSHPPPGADDRVGVGPGPVGEEDEVQPGERQRMPQIGADAVVFAAGCDAARRSEQGRHDPYQ